ncbi:MAG TPA: LPS assembly protein LptD [Gammaproteobacteria bacterium]|nr:LPS assembly protein LptD [Gammaproteobacteria bacterium]
MSRLPSRCWLAVALLLPAAVWAESPWDCSQQADGQWNCTGKAPPPVMPAVDGTASPPPESIEPAAEPAFDGTPEPDSPSTPPPAAAAGTALPPASEPAAEAATAPAEAQDTGGAPATAGPAATDIDNALEYGAPLTPLEQPDAVADPYENPATAPATSAKTGYDRWALCPPVERPPAVRNADTGTIDLQADSAQASEGNIYTLNGNAVVQYAGQRMEAENIVYRQDSGEIEAQQGIRYTAPGLYVSGESAALYPELQEGELRNVEYVLYDQHGRGEAKLLQLEGVSEQHLKEAYYTTCPPGNRNWILKAREVKLYQDEGTGTARDATVSFKGVPFFYTPYATFPIDERRKSGLLFPKIGQTEASGFDLSVPYYWNIAPNRDMTITPRYMSDRGEMLGTEFRYLTRHSNGVLRAEYLPEDKLYDDESRSLVSIRNNWRPIPRLRTRIIASNASDENYFEDLGTSLVQTSQTNLQRTAAAEYNGNWWDLNMMVQDYQTVDPDIRSSQRPYKQLPWIAFNATPDTRLLGMKMETSAELNHFVHSDNSLVEGSRIDVQPRLSLPLYRAAWYIDPAVSVRHTVYNLKNTAAGEDDSPSRTTPIASLDAGTFFERDGRWGDSSYVQTLEPRLYYLYVPYKNQDDLPVFDTGDYDFNFWTLFRENRFSGPDRMGDANQLALALTSRILDPASGRQIISTSLGSLLYFSNRRVTLPGEPIATDSSSDLIGEVTMELARNWNADAVLHWNPHDNSTSRHDYRLQYRRGPRQLVNLSYRQQSGLLEQTDMSFLWPLSPSWHVVGRWYYSLKASETIEALGGIGYESCCWAAQLLARSYIYNTEDERNNSVFLQLELKGLGKLGTRVDEALERGILGYSSNY